MPDKKNLGPIDRIIESEADLPANTSVKRLLALEINEFYLLFQSQFASDTKQLRGFKMLTFLFYMI